MDTDRSGTGIGIKEEIVTMLCDSMKNIAMEVQSELEQARLKFPGAFNLNAALMEEVGELARAQMQNLGYAAVRREAVQVMAMAIRIVEEGDRSLVINVETTQQ